MCNGSKPLPITITVTATTANPFPPGLSDGITTLPIGGPNDANFTTEVVPGQKITFKVAGDISAITAIKEGAGDLFSVDPSAANGWTGTVGPVKANPGSEYTICYNVNGAPNNPYCQDPKLLMKT